MLDEIKNEIEKAKNIVLVGHVNPDGDCIGATIAFKYMIEKFSKGKNIYVCINDELPKYVEKLPYLPKIYNEIDDNISIDLLISLDVANIERLAISEKDLKRSKKTICIDHHISNTGYFDINYVQDISSASELIYRFLNVFNIEMTKEIATYMYLGIINDTGNFRHSNVTDKTFLVASEIAKTDINMNEIYKLLFSKSMTKAKAYSESIEKGIYDKDLRFMWFYLPKNSGYTRDDTDGISEYLLSLEDVDVSLFIMQLEDGSIKGSFRSKGKDVNVIASKFNGGGHKLAAGFKTNMSSDEIIKKTKELLNEK